jgi:D-glycero-alpha-D-manno-heptose-7-phosphate kinase
VPVLRPALTITRTPVRISLGGGGTDLASYYKAYGGAALSMSINKYVFVTVQADNCTRYCSAETMLPQAVVRRLGLSRPAAIHVTTTVSGGTGLGTGGAITVGLVNAVSVYNGFLLPPGELAETAYSIEFDDLGLSCGKKDQYATAFGGINLFRFNQDDTVDVEPLHLPAEREAALRAHLMLFYTGRTRNSEEILRRQQELSASVIADGLHALKASTLRIAEMLRAGDFEAIGRQLDIDWEIKRAIVPGISNEVIDDAYARARAAGALGGRISGAGNGGYIIIFCSPDRHAAVRHALAHLDELAFDFDHTGSRVLYCDTPEGTGVSQWRPSTFFRTPIRRSVPLRMRAMLSRCWTTMRTAAGIPYRA